MPIDDRDPPVGTLFRFDQGIFHVSVCLPYRYIHGQHCIERCTVQIKFGSESVFELVKAVNKAEAGSWKRCWSKLVVVKRYGTKTKTGISSSSSSSDV